jgi:hypothetical protein
LLGLIVIGLGVVAAVVIRNKMLSASVSGSGLLNQPVNVEMDIIHSPEVAFQDENEHYTDFI